MFWDLLTRCEHWESRRRWVTAWCMFVSAHHYLWSRESTLCRCFTLSEEARRMSCHGSSAHQPQCSVHCGGPWPLHGLCVQQSQPTRPMWWLQPQKPSQVSQIQSTDVQTHAASTSPLSIQARATAGQDVSATWIGWRGRAPSPLVSYSWRGVAIGIRLWQRLSAYRLLAMRTTRCWKLGWHRCRS